MTRILAAVAILALGCGGEPSQAEVKASVIGTWTATSVTYSSDTYPTVEVIKAGATAILVVRQDGTLTYTWQPASGPAEVFDGTWEMDSFDLMRVHPQGASWYWAFDLQLSGNTMKLANGSGEYDFNDDGVMEPARWSLSLKK